jgi:hypothetical protein
LQRYDVVGNFGIYSIEGGKQGKAIEQLHNARSKFKRYHKGGNNIAETGRACEAK